VAYVINIVASHKNLGEFDIICTYEQRFNFPYTYISNALLLMNSLGDTHTHTYIRRHAYTHTRCCSRATIKGKQRRRRKHVHSIYTIHPGEYIIYSVFSGTGKKYRRVILWGCPGDIVDKLYTAYGRVRYYYYFTMLYYI